MVAPESSRRCLKKVSCSNKFQHCAYAIFLLRITVFINLLETVVEARKEYLFAFRETIPQIKH